MLTTHRNLTWQAPARPAAGSVTVQHLQRVAQARGYRLIDYVAAIAGDAAKVAAWEAWSAEIPLSWLPLDHFSKPQAGRHDRFDDCARHLGRAVL